MERTPIPLLEELRAEASMAAGGEGGSEIFRQAGDSPSFSPCGSLFYNWGSGGLITSVGVGKFFKCLLIYSTASPNNWSSSPTLPTLRW